jgi:nicotinamide-nucleotide amidase
MPTAEIIAIGTELLLGEIQDTNTRYLARIMRDIGVDIYRSTLIGDNSERIAQVICESVSRADIVITTGGLGPTVDDPTRQAVAIAMGVDLEFRPELWQQILDRFQRFNRLATDNNRKQAYIPTGSTAIENPVGTAPAFLYELGHKVIISLPGVPREMEYLIEHKVIPYLKDHFNLEGTIKALVLHTAGVGESQIDEWIGDLETLSNPTVGLLAHPGQVDIRITAKANSSAEADRLIDSVNQILHGRLSEHIFGKDDDKIEDVVYQKLLSHLWELTIWQYGLDGELSNRLPQSKYASVTIESLQNKYSSEEMKRWLEKEFQKSSKLIVMGITLEPDGSRQLLSLYLLTPKGYHESNRAYGGSPSNGTLWAATTAIDFLRREI